MPSRSLAFITIHILTQQLNKDLECLFLYNVANLQDNPL